MGLKDGVVERNYFSAHTITIFQNWYHVEVSTHQYSVTEISLFSCLALYLLNPSPVSIIPSPPSGGRYLIQNVPVIQNQDGIFSGNGPRRRRGWHSYSREGVIAAHM